MPFNRILVANRGEIAVRIIRACRDAGIETVLAASQADRDSLAARMADRTVTIGGARPSDSYLRSEAVVHAALATSCEAIHPGYGFLSEQRRLADLCAENKLVFIGPPPDVLELMGDKVAAREAALAAGLPVTQGGQAESAEDGIRIAAKIGYPVMLKASGGGGGRGIRVIHSGDELRQLFDIAATEASSAFGDGRLHIETYIQNARHVEIQVIGDCHGNVVDLGERDCSLQHNYQKIIEETPCPVLSADKRAEICAAAVKLLKRNGYQGLGTVEFLYDAVSGRYYFLEVNPRIQVEHPITEEVTRIDLVAEQISVASGAALSFKRSDVRFSGHCIQLRVNAQSPKNGLRPAPGRISDWVAPAGPGVRIDTHCTAGYLVPPYYDSLLAKLIVWGKDRDNAIRRARRALEEFVVAGSGLDTNILLLKVLCANRDFCEGQVTTQWLSKFLESAQWKESCGE